jgi:hypothetical protein
MKRPLPERTRLFVLAAVYLFGLLALIIGVGLNVADQRGFNIIPTLPAILSDLRGGIVGDDGDLVPIFQPTPQEISYDTGFRSNTNGLPFQNYGSRFPQGNLTVAEVQELFGDQICAQVNDGDCIPKPVTQLWIEQMNNAMKGGHCVGFTILSNDFFTGDLQPGQFTNQAQLAFDVAQSPEIMRKIAQNWVLQTTPEVVAGTVVGTPRDIVDALIKIQSPVDLGIFSRDGGGHSMLAYGINYQGDGIYHIQVYDNNWPGKELYVRVDYNANTWVYSVAGTNPENDPAAWEGDARTRSLIFVPLNIYQEDLTCPFCDNNQQSAANGVLAQIVAQNNMIISLSGDEGRPLRWVYDFE